MGDVLVSCFMFRFFLILMVVLELSAQAADQYAVMVWDKSNQEVCPLEIIVLPNVRLEMPLDAAGQPIKSQAKVIGVLANFSAKCGRVEVRRR